MGVRAFIVRCPNCNANLQVDGTVTSTTCAYCGTVSRIQPRTGMFQAPPKVPPNLAAMPVAVQRRSNLLPMIPFFIVIAVTLGGVAAATYRAHAISVAAQQTAVATTGSTATPRERAKTTSWAADHPTLADVDGDGTVDILGRAKTSGQAERVHLVAYSGKTGAQLWESPSLGPHEEISTEPMAAIGTTLYVATKAGELRGYDLRRSGAELWRVSLGEKVSGMCVGDRELVVETADDTWWAIDTAGAKRAASALFRFDRDYTRDEAARRFEAAGRDDGELCIPASWSHEVPGRLSLRAWSNSPDIEGMSAGTLVKHRSGPVLVVGYKTPGTSVPMLAGLAPEAPPTKSRRFKWPAVRWTAQVPSSDPLTSRLDQDHVTVDETAVYALYEVEGKPNRLVAFEVTTGARRWEREVPTTMPLVGIFVVGDAVAVTTWSAIEAFAAADGRPRYRIGEKL